MYSSKIGEKKTYIRQWSWDVLICFENIIYRTGNEIFLLYMSDCFLQLLGEMTESTMLNVILKHVHRLVAFYSVFPKLVKLMMKVTTYLNLMSLLIYVYIFSYLIFPVRQNSSLERIWRQLWSQYLFDLLIYYRIEHNEFLFPLYPKY